MTEERQISGAEYDRIVEEAMEAEAASRALSDIYVQLDTIADSNDLPGPLRNGIRGMQVKAQGLIDDLDELAEEKRAKQEAMLEEMRG